MIICCIHKIKIIHRSSIILRKGAIFVKLVLLSAFTSNIGFPWNCNLGITLSIHSFQVLDRIISGVEEFGFCNKGWIESPIKGAEGNKEFLACFHRIPISESQPEVKAKDPVT